jgi:hypothetical protein
MTILRYVSTSINNMFPTLQTLFFMAIGKPETHINTHVNSYDEFAIWIYNFIQHVA